MRLSEYREASRVSVSLCTTVGVWGFPAFSLGDTKRFQASQFSHRGVWIDPVLSQYTSGLHTPRLYGTYRMKKFDLPVSRQASRNWEGFKIDEGLHVSTCVRRDKQAKATKETFRREYKARYLHMYLQNRSSIKLVIVTASSYHFFS